MRSGASVEPQRLLELAQGRRARREIRRPLEAVAGESLRRVGPRRAREFRLGSPRRHPDSHGRPADSGEPLAKGRRVRRELRDEHLRGDVRSLGPVVDLLDEPRDEVAGIEGFGLVDDPRALADDPPVAHVEHVGRGLVLLVLEPHDVDVHPGREHDGVPVEDGVDRREPVAGLRRGLESLAPRRVLHRAGEVAHDPLGVAREDRAHLLRRPPVLVGRDAPDARGRALVDVAEEARAIRARGPREDSRAARAHREDGQEGVEGLADRPDLGVRPEVARAPASGVARDEHPRELLAHRDGEERVRLVVLEDDVEPGVVLAGSTNARGQEPRPRCAPPSIRPTTRTSPSRGCADGGRRGSGNTTRRGSEGSSPCRRTGRGRARRGNGTRPDASGSSPARGGTRPDRSRRQPTSRQAPAGVRRGSVRCGSRRRWPPSSGVPSATTTPPPDPPSGPRSTTQSEHLITSRLCSMTMTVLPLSTSPWSTDRSLRTSSK